MKSSTFNDVVAELQHGNSSKAPMFPALDGLRGFAIILVVIGHYWTIASETPLSRPPVILWNTDLTFVFLLAGYGVRLFFVMSAFLLYLPYQRAIESGSPLPSVGSFYLRRFLRIFPAFAFCVLVSLLLISVFGSYLQIKLPSALNLLSNIAFIQPLTIFWGDGTVKQNILEGTWSLAVEVYFYIALPLLGLITRRQSSLYILTAVFVGAALYYRLEVYPAVDALNWSPEQKSLALLNIIPYLDSFAFGMLSAHLYVKLSSSTNKLALLWAKGLMYIGLLGVAYTLAFPFQPLPFAPFIPTAFTGSDLVFSLSTCLLIPGMLMMRSAISRVFANTLLRFIGLVSYSVFLSHMLLARFVADPLLNWSRVYSFDDRFTVLIAIFLPISVALGAALYIVVERPFLVTDGLQQVAKFPKRLFDIAKGEFSLTRCVVVLVGWYGLAHLVYHGFDRPPAATAVFTAAKITDSNWSQGVSRDGRKLVILYDHDLYQTLTRAKYVVLENGSMLPITKVVDTGGRWIHLYALKIDPEEMSYPHRLTAVPQEWK
jgi:peptidoglycan/LPS O-acetylase OafA/YrhL